jgi:hypothetical protein
MRLSASNPKPPKPPFDMSHGHLCIAESMAPSSQHLGANGVLGVWLWQSNQAEAASQR